MSSKSLFALFRWGLTVGLVLMAYYYFSYAMDAWMQTAAPGGSDQAAAWAYEAYDAFGRTVALLTCAFMALVNVRPGWPYLRSRWNLLLTGVALAAFFIPPAMRYFTIDGCLDAGGSWDYDRSVCISPA
jgi:hypothetical protein